MSGWRLVPGAAPGAPRRNVLLLLLYGFLLFVVVGVFLYEAAVVL